jgi:hypothetical protein
MSFMRRMIAADADLVKTPGPVYADPPAAF